jgi:hypothetical protein
VSDQEESVVNITPTASAANLRQDLEREARKRGKPMRGFVGAIYTYAVANRKRFAGSLKEARAPKGDHIGASVSADVAKHLSDWAKAEQTSRGLWCCYILQRALQDNMLDKIFVGSTEEG